MKNLVYVSGHKNPDSDSICSAISYSYFKKVSDPKKTYIPISLGNISDETKFILNYFNVKSPQYLESLYPTVGDIISSTSVMVDEKTSIFEVNNIFNETDSKTIIVEKEKKLYGIVTPSKLNYVWNNLWSTNILHISNTPFKNIVETLEATIIKNTDIVDMSGDIKIYQENNNELNKGDILITYCSKNNIQALLKSNVGVIIITACDILENDINEIISKSDKTVLITTHNIFDTSRLLVLSAPISYVTETDVVCFDKTNLLIDVKDMASKTRLRSFPVVENETVLGIILRDDIFSSHKKNIILTDHNEFSQSIDGIANGNILEVIDHHKAGNITSIDPMFIRTEIVGCTCTIIASMYLENEIEIPKEYAGIMLGAIISDTLLFKSPTCTNKDRVMAKLLSNICGIDDIEAFGIELLKAGTSLKGRTAEELLMQDFKEFNYDVASFGIGQINIMDFEDFRPFKSNIIKEMNILLTEKKYDFILLVVTNVLTEDSILVCIGNQINKVERAFNVKFVDNEALAKGIVSRKKQVVPMISNV
ncbi:MAG: putative manganese-dependent inorganic diphosphatase, partial [Bacilli bacterium]